MKLDFAMFRFGAVLLLLPLASGFFNRSPPCVPEYQALEKCFGRVDGCQDCDIIGPLLNPFDVGFCDSANDSLCNAYGCCQPCENEFETYESCLADLISKLTFNTCDVECDRAPTPAPTQKVIEAGNEFIQELEDQGCLNNFVDFATCAVQNPVQCGSCLISNIPSDPFEDGFCQAAESAICGFGTCCEPCKDEFALFDSCFEVIVQDVTFGSCEINCDNFQPAPSLDLACAERISNYTKCVTENPLECAPCAILNLPSDPRVDGFCEVATNTVCGFAQCCTSCNETFQQFDECFEDWVSAATIGQCKMDCDTYEGPTTANGNCVESLQEYTDCVLENPFDCALCVIQNLPNPGEDDFCQAAADSVCGFGDCCKPCATQFDDFAVCFESFASAVTLGDCKIDCNAGANPRDIWFGGRALRGTE
jgi:hypothetical protein